MQVFTFLMDRPAAQTQQLSHATLLQFHSSLQPVKLLLPSLQGMLCSEEQAQQRRMNCAPYVPFSSHHGVKRYSSPFREEVLYVVIYKYCAQVVKNVPDHLEPSGNLIQFKGFPQGRVVLCCQ